MGNTKSVFNKRELDEFEENTYFSAAEIYRIFERFCQLQHGMATLRADSSDPEKQLQKDQKQVKKDVRSLATKQLDEYRNALVTEEMLRTLPELTYNPFTSRIIDVFASEENGSMTFEDFVDMLSVFSEAASRDIKASYAFRLYDIDSDGFLDRSDLVHVLKLMCSQAEDVRGEGADPITEDEINRAVTELFFEADADGDEKLSYVEFEHIISKAPDFINTFKITI